MQYKIDGYQHFTSEQFPRVAAEVQQLKESMLAVTSNVKADMVISFFKDHSLSMQWVSENKDLTTFLTSRRELAANIESLFEACRANKIFLVEFEEFIRIQLQTTDNYNATIKNC